MSKDARFEAVVTAVNAMLGDDVEDYGFADLVDAARAAHSR